MTTFKITLAYDGTGYVGWQRQANGVSIQAVLEDALRALDGREVPVSGAGRTDAGVHALGQVASFTIARDLKPEALVRALNAHLPRAIRVLSVEEASPAFHARFSARTKTYQYRLWNGEVMSPFESTYAWHVPGPLDVEAMRAGARLLEGRHDFAAFQATGSSVTTTEREIFSSRIVDCGLRIGEESTIESAVRNPQSAMLCLRSDRRRLPPPHGPHRCRIAGRDRTRPADGRMVRARDRRARSRGRGPDGAAAWPVSGSSRVSRRACGWVLKACTLGVYSRRNRNVA